MKRKKLILRLLQFGFLLAIVGGLVVLLSPAWRQAPALTLPVEVARIPATMFARYSLDCVVPRTGEIILTGFARPAIRDLSVFKLSNGRLEKLFPVTGQNVPGVPAPKLAGISPDGKSLLFGSTGTSSPDCPPLLHLRMDGRKLLWSSQGCMYFGHNWKPFSDNGSHFVACKSASGLNLWLYDSGTGKPLRQIASVAPGSYFGFFGFLPGSQDVQYIELPPAVIKDWRLWRVNAKTGKPRLIRRFERSYRIYPSPRGDLFAQVFVNGGKALKFGKMRLPLGNQRSSSSLIVLDAYRTMRRKVYQCGGNELVDNLKWSRDSKSIALVIQEADGKHRIDIVDAASGAIVRRHRVQTKRMYLYDWYPDSKSVLCGYDTETHTILQKLSINNSR